MVFESHKKNYQTSIYLETSAELVDVVCMSDYYREQEQIYSKPPYLEDSSVMHSNYEMPNNERAYSRGRGFLADSHSFFDRVKSKLSMFRGYDSQEYLADQDSAAERQSQLWNAIKRKPIQLIIEDSMDKSQVAEPQQFGQAPESANTFLTDNQNDNYVRSTASPKRKDLASGVPLSGSPFASGGISDFIGLERDAILSKNSTSWEKVTAKSPLRSATTLGTIQKRLLQISSKKNEVSKGYQKLLKELNEWWQETIEAEENMSLISDLQQMFHEDLVFEQRLSDKLKEVSKALEFTKMREEEMLQERKELQHTIKKYGQMRAKKGNHSEEAHFLKEKVITKQNSLSVITGHYQQSLSTTARELFVNASVEYFETASDIKDTSKTFFQNSVEYLRTVRADNIEQHIEDLRRKRADKHWSKLNAQERDDPNRLVEIMSGMYNGQDSLMRCVERRGHMKAPEKSPANCKENQPRFDSQPDLKLEFKTGLDESLSVFPSESAQKKDLKQTSTRSSELTEGYSKTNAHGFSFDSHRTLRCEGLAGKGPSLKTRLPYPETNETIRAPNLKLNFDNNNIRLKNLSPNAATNSEDGTLIKFPPHGEDVSRFAYEPEQDLDRNKWAESPRT